MTLTHKTTNEKIKYIENSHRMNESFWSEMKSGRGLSHINNNESTVVNWMSGLFYDYEFHTHQYSTVRLRFGAIHRSCNAYVAHIYSYIYIYAVRTCARLLWIRAPSARMSGIQSHDISFCRTEIERLTEMNSAQTRWIWMDNSDDDWAYNTALLSYS